MEKQLDDNEYWQPLSLVRCDGSYLGLELHLGKEAKDLQWSTQTGWVRVTPFDEHPPFLLPPHRIVIIWEKK